MDNTANQAASAALLVEPPVGWLDLDETCRRLKTTPRRLNEAIAAGKGPEKVMVKRHGKRPAPYYSPADVERLEQAMQPRPRVFSAESGVGPAPAATAIAAPGVLELLDRIGARLCGAVERRPADRGPFLTITAAAELYGIQRATLRWIAEQRAVAGDRDLYQTAAGELRIREALVAELDAQELHAADVARPRRKPPARLLQLVPTRLETIPFMEVIS